MSDMPMVRIHAPNDLRTDQVSRPVAGDNDVVVQVAQCGICGSDLSYAKIGGIPGAASPFALGHEFSGSVAEVGANVSHVSVGDRVVINPEAGANGIGSGGLKGAFAPYILFENAAAYPQGVLKLPESLDLEMGALIEPLSVGMHGVNQGKIGADDKVVVFGAGPVGLSAAVVARYYGAQQVVVVDLSEKRLAVAAELGLIPFKADAGDISDFLKQQHGTVSLGPLLGEQAATDVYIEATGVGPVFQQILEVAGKGARVVVIGVHFAPVEINMIGLLMRELQLTAAMSYTTEFEDVIKMLESGRVEVSPMISHRFPLSEFAEAFAQAQRQDEAVKVLVDCQG